MAAPVKNAPRASKWRLRGRATATPIPKVEPDRKSTRAQRRERKVPRLGEDVTLIGLCWRILAGPLRVLLTFHARLEATTRWVLQRKTASGHAASFRRQASQARV